MSNLIIYWLFEHVFLIRPSFPNAVGKGAFGVLPLTAWCLYDLWDAMQYHYSLNASRPALPGGAEDFPGGDKYPGDVPLPTFLAYLQPY